MEFKPMLKTNRIVCLLVLSSTFLPWVRVDRLRAAAAGPAAVGGWVNVTNNVGGEKWGAYGVTYMTAVPGSDAVIAGVSECGLWKTTDGGKVWKKLGGNEIKCRPGRIVFDPREPGRVLGQRMLRRRALQDR